MYAFSARLRQKIWWRSTLLRATRLRFVPAHNDRVHVLFRFEIWQSPFFTFRFYVRTRARRIEGRECYSYQLSNGIISFYSLRGGDRGDLIPTYTTVRPYLVLLQYWSVGGSQLLIDFSFFGRRRQSRITHGVHGSLGLLSKYSFQLIIRM